jgi:hypothetical protein
MTQNLLFVLDNTAITAIAGGMDQKDAHLDA